MEAETDVLIVGLGPVGATLAALLHQHGVRAIACDRETEIYRLPRAAHFDAEIMRLFDQLGIAGEMHAASRTIDAYEFVNAGGDILMRFAVPATTGHGWPASFMFHQPALEEALRRKLREADVELLCGWSLGSFVQDAGGVTASLTCGGKTRAVRARYLAGCDGGNSLVRRMIDSPLFDYGFDEPWLVVDTLMADESRLKPHGVQLCDPARPVTIMPMSPGRRRWEFMLLPGEEAQAMLDDAVVQRLMAPWAAPGEAEIVRKAVYRFHGLVAQRWRDRRVFLAGDSAHQMPPFAGQGMCSGLRDAANLAWKLALVLKGEAGDGLLDTYQQEREPHVRGYIELAIGMGKVVCTLDAAAAAARDTQMVAARATQKEDSAAPPSAGFARGFFDGSRRAGEMAPHPAAGGIDYAAGRFTLLTRAPCAVPKGMAVQALAEGPLADWLGDAEAALIRPDRCVFGTGRAVQLITELGTAIRA